MIEWIISYIDGVNKNKIVQQVKANEFFVKFSDDL